MRTDIIIIVLFLTVAASFADVWQYEDVYSSTTDHVFRPSIAMENGETVRIAFRRWIEDTSSALMYAEQTGSGWDVSASQESSTSDQLAMYLSLALTDEGNPCIAYSNNKSGGELDYTCWNGSEWENSIVTSGEYIGQLSLELNSGDNRPAIAYSRGFGSDDHDVMYAELDGSWQISAVDTVGNRGVWISMALASDNTPHVSYFNFLQTNLMYGYREAGQWQTSVIATGYSVGLNNSIALDSNDFPHVTFQDFYNGDVDYVYYTGTDWEHVEVDKNGTLGDYCISIALDSNDNPHFSYYDTTNDQLKYACFDGSSWEITVIDTGTEAGVSSSLAIDNYNRPHIAYVVTEGTENIIRHAHFAPLGIEGDEQEGRITLSITPDPCTGSAAVHFTLPEAGHATVDMYDVSGRRVAELADEVFSEGLNSITTGELTTGVYLCRLTAGGFSATERLVVIN